MAPVRDAMPLPRVRTQCSILPRRQHSLAALVVTEPSGNSAAAAGPWAAQSGGMAPTAGAGRQTVPQLLIPALCRVLRSAVAAVLSALQRAPWPDWLHVVRSRTVQKEDRRRSGSCAVVIVEHSTEALAPMHRLRWRDDRGGPEKLVCEALMIAFSMVVRHEVANRVLEGGLSEEDHSVQALGFY
jgi:hypothetical protein